MHDIGYIGWFPSERVTHFLQAAMSDHLANHLLDESYAVLVHESSDYLRK